jgi:FkbH-like protein
LEAKRRITATHYASADEFLQSLEMRIVVSRFDHFHLPRIAQLIQRSNQFNLTTQRHNEAECARMMKDLSIIPLYVKLSDKLGDHGLISVVILEVQDKNLCIKDWLMSCRVFSRGVERYVMNEVFAYARKTGATQVVGRFIPSSRNEIVRDFYRQFGFSPVFEAEGSIEWTLSVQEYQPTRVYIRAVEPESAAVAP